ncbi:aromatic amino acid lyase, partial [Mesorhizobium sp.]|uniref:aromatic amino acid lyase n=1 Tax=Mesorhizobium sp. TaxID=1871066 RepID=UPI000FE918B5
TRITLTVFCSGTKPAEAPLAVSKCAEMIVLWQRLIAFELMAAAQAVDLRNGLTLGPATAAIHAAVRALVLPLNEDRPQGIDAEAIYAALASGSWQA